MRFRPFLAAALCFLLWLGATLDARAAQPELTLYHPMAWGESLADTAAQFGVPVETLAAANGIGDLYMLHPGRWLTLPPDGEGSATEPPQKYTVQPGDTLFRIATQFDTTVDALAAANGIADPSSIQVGQILTIPGGSAGTAEVHAGPLQSLEWLPSPVRQGQTLVVRALAADNAVLDGLLDGKRFAFTRDGNGLFALIPIAAAEPAGAQELIVWAGSSLADRVRAAVTVQVAEGQFETSIITIPPDRTYLLDAALVEQDRQALAQAFGMHTVKRLWDGTFLQPTEGVLTESFGARRTYNDGARVSQHGGIDLGAVTGTPVRAANAGRVVFTGVLQVYGNGIVIDHGLGLCTAYFHLNSIDVQIGQTVARGESIGAVGNTGLSTGSHLHWEMRLSDVPINPAQWMSQTIP